MSDLQRALSFGSVAESYERGRPGYPEEAVEWLLSSSGHAVGSSLDVLELGAGTGKLTEVIAGLGHRVFAIDPDNGMLDILSAKLPDVRSTVGTAEMIPAPDGMFDVVIAAQAFHWFDPAKALPEIARVLRPGGQLALVWNEPDKKIPWVRKLSDMVRIPDHRHETLEGTIEASGFFSAVDSASFKMWQRLDRKSIQDLALSRSTLAITTDEVRNDKVREVLALYDDYGRGMDGMQMPYDCMCYRMTVINRPAASAMPVMSSDTEADLSEDETSVRLPKVDESLIKFD